MSINRVTLTGNLTRDPELRYAQNGTPILDMGLAVNDRVKNQQTGQWEDRPNFVDLAMFGTRAERVAPYLAKGSKVAVEGRLRWSQWQAKDGGKRSKLEVVVDEIEFMSRDGAAPRQRAGYAPQPAQPAYGNEVPYDATIPF